MTLSRDNIWQYDDICLTHFPPCILTLLHSEIPQDFFVLIQKVLRELQAPASVA